MSYPRERPPIPSRENRPPLPSKVVGPPSNLAASYKQLPTLQQWRADTPTGRIGGRAGDPVLRFIDEVIDALPTAKDGEVLYHLGQLFFSTLSWVNRCKTNPFMAAANRRPVLSLNLYAGNALAAGFECSLSELPAKMQQLYGVEMSQHGIDTDQKEKPRYFDAVKREMYRTFVYYGRLRHYRSSTKTFHKLDTAGSYTEGRPGFGFVLSMSNELFVGNFGLMSKTYHSTFMAGRPVQCAGTMQIADGVVTHIKNDSGHYKPVDTSLVKVLLHLRMFGADVSRIVVTTVPKQQGQLEKETTGIEFINANGNWDGIRARAAHQSPW